MFSKIPVPTLRWEEQDMKFVMIFFPFVGAIIGALCLLWNKLIILFDFNNLIQGAGFMLIPILITGGLHLDGLSDTADALASNKSKEEKKLILKDPHIGAFGVISLILYLICFFSFAASIPNKFEILFCFALSFIISRSYAGIAILTFNCSSETGLARTFASSASKKICFVFLCFYLIIAFTLNLYFGGMIGLVAVLASSVSFIYFRLFLVRKFGGNSGDLTGWFIQICELITLIFIVIFHRIIEVIL